MVFFFFFFFCSCCCFFCRLIIWPFSSDIEALLSCLSRWKKNKEEEEENERYSQAWMLFWWGSGVLLHWCRLCVACCLLWSLRLTAKKEEQTRDQCSSRQQQNIQSNRDRRDIISFFFLSSTECCSRPFLAQSPSIPLEITRRTQHSWFSRKRGLLCWSNRVPIFHVFFFPFSFFFPPAFVANSACAVRNISLPFPFCSTHPTNRVINAFKAGAIQQRGALSRAEP